MSIAIRRYVLMGLLTAFTLAGCADDEDLTGAYAGTVLVNALGLNLSIPVTVSLSQSGSTLSGTFEATNPTGVTDRGSITGTVNGSKVTFAFAPTTAGSCPADLDGTRSGKTISGTIQIRCPGQPVAPGTFTISKSS